MHDPRNIMEAIDLLMSHPRKNRIPWYVKPLDYTLASLVLIGFWGGFLFLLYKLFQWL